MWIFPLAAALVSGVFAALLAQQWLARSRPNLLAWSIALAMFAVASFSAALGILDQWSESLFRIYYLFGAILNVPVLALGTVYLLAPRRAGHALAAAVGVATIFAAGAVFTADLRLEALATAGIPSAADVMPDPVRTVSRYYSYSGFLIVVAGALWSAWRLSRRQEEHLRRLASANVLIASGTFAVAVASGFARFGKGAVFSIGLLVGVVLMFSGFLKTRARPHDREAAQARPDAKQAGSGEEAGGVASPPDAGKASSGAEAWGGTNSEPGDGDGG